MRRHLLVVIVAVIAAVAIGVGVAVAVHRTEKVDPQVQLFGQPDNFCGIVKQQSFTSQVDGVIASGPDLRPRVALVFGGLIHKAAKADGTPRELVEPLSSIGDNVTIGTDASLVEAKVAATQADLVARRHCG